MNDPTWYVNGTEVFTRAGQVPNAQWATGCLYAASNSPGIGISTGVTNLEESDNWTLLDQFGEARTPQIGQMIGKGESFLLPGIGVSDNAVATGNGDYSLNRTGSATLSSLATGWESAP